MTNNLSCAAYRQTLFSRAGCTGHGDCNNNQDKTLGAYWFDDSVEAIIQTLIDSNKLDNTFFLFQMDHGKVGKNTNWEVGTRLASFVHYPPFGVGELDVPISVIDIAATVFELARVNPPYELDGDSWVSLATGDSSEILFWRDKRCLFFEYIQDRAVRCGCYKYMRRHSDSTLDFLGHSQEAENLFDLCDGADFSYSTANNMELGTKNLLGTNTNLVSLDSNFSCTVILNAKFD